VSKPTRSATIEMVRDKECKARCATPFPRTSRTAPRPPRTSTCPKSALPSPLPEAVVVQVAIAA